MYWQADIPVCLVVGVRRLHTIFVSSGPANNIYEVNFEAVMEEMNMKKFLAYSLVSIASIAAVVLLSQRLLLSERFIAFIPDEDRNVARLTSTVTARVQDKYKVEVSGMVPSVVINVDLDKVPFGGCAFNCFHALILPTDYSTIYHGHPFWMRKGALILPLPGMKNGHYEMWLELAAGLGHDDVPFLKKFALEITTGNVAQVISQPSRLSMEPVKLEINQINQSSHFEFLLKLDGEPVEEFEEFVGVKVHSFIMKKDGSYFRHDHASTTGNGIVDAHFTFSDTGDYFLYLQPTVKTKTGELVREVLRYPFTVK